MEIITVLVLGLLMVLALMTLARGTAETTANMGTVAGEWNLWSTTFYKTLAGAILFTVSLIGLLDLIPI